MKLPIAYYGSSSLRKKTKKVLEITEDTQKLIDDMIETMCSLDGLGIAAPQVFREEAIFITRVPEQLPDGKWVDGKIRAYINPKILSYSAEVQQWEEGCLSIPGLYLMVPRPSRILVEAMDRNGNVFQEELQGFFACNFCHENDHLNGVLHIDRTDPETKNRIKSELKKIKEKYSTVTAQNSD